MALTRPRLGQINTTVSNFTDPIVVFNAGSTQANVDQGILFNRANGLVSNVALFFSESANSFVLGFTANSGSTNSNIQITSNANLKVQGLFVENFFWANGAQIYLDSNLFYSLDANVGAYQIYANANAASQQTQIDNLNTQAYANANVAAYLPTYSGSIGGTLTTASQPNITTLGNLTSFGASFGSTVAQGNLTVVGNLTVQGNTLTIGSNNLTVVDSIIDLHTFANLDPLISDDGRDIGLRFHYYKGADTHAFLGWENNVETLVYLQNSNETNSNITGTFGNVHFGSLLLSNTEAASSTTTGALQVRGGVGVSGALFITNTGDVSANVGAYQTYANANVVVMQSNLGAYQTFANNAIVSLYTNANANTAAYLSTYAGNVQAGNLLITGNIRADSNVFANIFYVSNSIRWAGNGAVFASGGGGGGTTYTANTAPPTSGNVSGDMWYNTSADILYEYVNDGTTSYWVDVQSLGQTGNITTISDATLQGNIIVGLSNVYSIGTSTGYVRDIFANTITANNISIQGNIVPNANVQYNLGSPNFRFKDLFLSGNTIDLGGATIKTDGSTGAIALIPQPTVSNPNPTGVVISAAGSITTVTTTGGEVSANAIGNSTTSGSSVGANTATISARIWASKIFWG
jgi:hypothetical protein